MGNRSVVVDLIVNTARWTAGFQKASHDMASATTNAETKTRALQQQVGLLGVGMTAFSALAVRAWARFDQQMSRVEATGGEAAARINDLTEAAKGDDVTQLGYSASEAAESIYELTKAGVDADAILAGGLAGSLALAAAETMDAAEAASIMASALGQFNLEGEQSAHVADLITAAAGKAQGSAHDLGFALKQSGLVANQFGLSIEETTGTLGLFANAGLIGSDAGTSLRTMLLHLVGPSGKAAELMDEIGFSAYGANGQLVSMEELGNRLQSSMGKLTEEQRNQALATIFGADATRAASLLYREGGDAVAEWTEKVNDAGYAQEVARKRMDNLNGDLKILSSTWDKFLIGMGESADAPLRGVVQGITDIIDAFADLPPAAQGIVMALSGAGGLGILGVLAIGQVMTALNSLQTGLVNTGRVGEAQAARITTGMKVATLATGALGAAATLGFAAWATAAAEAEAAIDGYVATLTEAGEATDATIDHIRSALTEGQDLGWNDFFGNYDLISNAEKMGIAIDDLAGYILGEADAVERVQAAWTEYQGSTLDLGSTGRHVDIQQMTTALDNQAGSLEKAKEEKKLQSEVTDRMADSSSEAAGEEEALGNAAAEAAARVEEQTKAIQENIDAWQELAGIHMNADEAMANYEQAVDDANEAIKAAQTDTEKYSDLLGENRDALDLNTQAGRDAQDALQGIAEAAGKQMQAQYDAGASTAELTAQMREARSQFVAAAMDAGLTMKAAQRLADSYGLIPSNVDTNINASDNATGKIRNIKAELAQLRDQTIYITTVRRNATERAKRGAPGNNDAGFAQGGALYGGVPNQDSIPIWGMPGEHMLTKKDVDAMGGQAGVYAFRAALHASGTGLMGIGMAAGGAVGTAKRELAQQVRFRKVASKNVRSAREANEKKDTLASRRALAAAEDRLAEVDEKIDELRARVERLTADRQDNIREMRRGQFREGITGGLGGAQSAIDEMYERAFSGDFSKSQSKSLANAARAAEKSLTFLYKRSEALEERLSEARDRLQEMQQISSQVASGITGGFALSDVKGSVNPWSGEEAAPTGHGMLVGAKSYAAKVETLALRLRSLQKKGYNGAILQEIAGMPVEQAIAAADSLLELSDFNVQQFNAAYESIDVWAQRAGNVVTEGFYKGGVNAAQGIVDGLESQQEKVEAAILKMAKAMEKALKKALGIHSPSTVFDDLMDPVGDGTVLGLRRQHPKVGREAAKLIDVASGRFVGKAAFTNTTAGSYGVGTSSSSVVKNINIDVVSYNAVAEKDSVITNKALQSVAAIGE